MTWIFVDTRSHRGCWVAAHAAGLCDLDVVALVAKDTPSKNVLGQMRMAIERVSSFSIISTVEIPCSTVEAVSVVRDLAGMNDIVVTDSAPFAYEFLQVGGEATDCFGEAFSRGNIDAKVRHFHACKELKSLGVNPYKPRPYRTADRERLLGTLERLIKEVCSASPKEVPIDLRRDPAPWPAVESLSLSEFELESGARVFVDGDSCPRLPEILEICGKAHVPVVFVSNNEPEYVARSVRRASPWLELKGEDRPDLSIETVPMEKNAADRYIEQHVSLGDIVLTDDTALITVCMNKGALVIDYRGRALGRPQGCGMLRKADVKAMRASSSVGRKKKSRASAFRRSLTQAVG